MIYFTAHKTQLQRQCLWNEWFPRRHVALQVSSVENIKERQVEHPRCVHMMDGGSVATVH